MGECLGEQEMLWEHKHNLQASVSTAFLSSPKLSIYITSGIYPTQGYWGV